MSYTIKQLADRMCVQPEDIVNRLKATGHLSSADYLEQLNNHDVELDDALAVEVVQSLGFQVGLHGGTFTVQDPLVLVVTRVPGGQVDHGKMRLCEAYAKAGNTCRNVKREGLTVVLPSPDRLSRPDATWRYRPSN